VVRAGDEPAEEAAEPEPGNLGDALEAAERATADGREFGTRSGNLMYAAAIVAAFLCATARPSRSARTMGLLAGLRRRAPLLVA
jgi:hypothetical protein